VTREDHRDQEDHRTHHREQLPAQQNTGHQYILSEYIKCIMYVHDSIDEHNNLSEISGMMRIIL
jgi:hypothetical protein